MIFFHQIASIAWPKAAVWRFGSSCSWPSDWGKHQLADPEISDLYVSWFWKDDKTWKPNYKTYQDNLWTVVSSFVWNFINFGLPQWCFSKLIALYSGVNHVWQIVVTPKWERWDPDEDRRQENTQQISVFLNLACWKHPFTGYQKTYALPKFNNSSLKNAGWKTILFYWEGTATLQELS